VLADGLVARGHHVTLFAPGDSTFGGDLVATVPRALWNDGFHPDPAAHYAATCDLVLARATDYDVIHSHLDHRGFELAERSKIPVITTVHGRTDVDPMAASIRAHPAARLVAISAAQRSFVADGNWIATIHHGLDFSAVGAGRGGGSYLAFVGRLSPDKGLGPTIDVARRSGTMLRIAAKALDPVERGIYDMLVAPAVAEGVVEFLGELNERERDELVGGALATVMLSIWPEPFGLVAIESLALGTPLIASRAGALPEIVVDRVDGLIVEDAVAGASAVPLVAQLDRARIRQRALDRFSAARMLDDYERVYGQVLGEPAHSQR